jgi:hypothetical protein
MEYMYSSWLAPRKDLVPGYTLLLPVPADLPVFLQIAINSLANQDLTHLRDVLVIPDQPSASFARAYNEIIKHQPLLPTRLIQMSSLDKLVGRLSKSPNLFHFLQLLYGVNNTSTTHVMLHDADLFLRPGSFLRDQFELCRGRSLSILGLNPRQKESKNAGRLLVGTWEMMATVEWFKRFTPYQHRGRPRLFNGELRKFDTTLFPQNLTNPDEIGFNTSTQNFVHFRFVISTYRMYKTSQGPYEDKNFKILLIRLLIDSLQGTRWEYDVPTLESCISGLEGRDKRISYTSPEAAANYHHPFRARIERLLNLGTLNSEQTRTIRESVRSFDERFRYTRARNFPYRRDKLEAELSGRPTPGGSYEKIAIHRDADRLDSQSG